MKKASHSIIFITILFVFLKTTKKICAFLSNVFLNMHVCQSIEERSEWVPIALLRTATLLQILEGN